jgi:hypothetical protein
MLTLETLDRLSLKELQDYSKQYGLSHYGTKEKLRRYLRDHVQTMRSTVTTTTVKLTVDQEITMECVLPAGKSRNDFLVHVVSFFSA